MKVVLKIKTDKNMIEFDAKQVFKLTKNLPDGKTLETEGFDKLLVIVPTGQEPIIGVNFLDVEYLNVEEVDEKGLD